MMGAWDGGAGKAAAKDATKTKSGMSVQPDILTKDLLHGLTSAYTKTWTRSTAFAKVSKGRDLIGELGGQRNDSFFLVMTSMPVLRTRGSGVHSER